MRKSILSLLGSLAVSAAALGFTIRIPTDYHTIQRGIQAAADGDTVLVADGIYSGPGNKNLDFRGKAITVISENGAEHCVIDCRNHGRGFYFHSGEDSSSVLSGFTITNGQLFYGSYWDNSGGGILTYDCSPLIENCLIINNDAYYNGGGIHCYYGAPLISNCLIRGNTAHGGGGIHTVYASPSIENCIIDSNIVWAEESGGGGICCGDSTVIYNCVISNNTANEWQGGGGGIMCSGSVTISSCTISGNSADAGGGIWCTGSPTIIDCIITDNNCYSAGGLMCGLDANPHLINCIISDNNGPGIHCYNSVVELAGCNISFNEGGGIWSSTGGQVVFDHLNRCSIYGNRQIWYPNGNDLYELGPTLVIVDTFTVMNPTDYFATPIQNYTFDILHAYTELQNADLYVSPHGENTNSGLTPDDPLKNIDFAVYIIIGDSLNLHTIHLAPGIYSLETNREEFPVMWKEYISLQGSGQDATILNGGGNLILQMENADSVWIEDITFSNGNWTNGGAMYLVNSSGGIANCAFRSNSVNICGGGIYSAGCVMEISNCIFENNHGGYNHEGGAIYCSSNQTIRDCIFRGNSAGEGGAIKIHGCDPLISNCVFEGNSAEFGGGISISPSACPQIENCVFTGNSADYGGALDLYYSPNPLISNCILSRNFASIWGGGVFSSFNSLTFENVTISGNSADQEGGGLFFLDSHPVFSAENRCNIYRNSAGYGYGCDISSYYNFTPDTIDVIVDTFTVLEPTDYHTHPIAYYTFDILHEYSPAVNSGLGEVPHNNHLFPPFPNPFNSTVSIRFEMRNEGYVTLKIYDISGREVATLVKGIMTAGIHRIDWKAEYLPSGIYLLRLDAGKDFNSTRKLLLLK